MEWKTIGSGDYAVGLEPANASVFGRKYHVEHDSLTMIKPFEPVVSSIKVEIIEGDDEAMAFKNMIKELTPDAF